MIDFSTPFQDFNYTQFFQEFLPEDLTLQKEDLLRQSYQKYITEGHILGTVKSLNLTILEFKQSSNHDPRVSLAKEAFRIMADHRIRRSLVIFWNAETKNWRLSLMTISLDIDDKNKIVRNYSNAKRFSFLLGEGEAMKTPKTQLSSKVKDFEDLQKRFSVEVVRKEFFDDYIDLFIRLYINISEDEGLIKVLANQGIDRVKFTKNLLGKIIFVYFVQKKGWLGLDRDGTWGNGDKNFMRSLWNRFSSGDTFVRPSTGFFYNDYLEHLFYNGFNKDRRDDEAYEPNMRMKVPYLNGGLFKEDYRDWEHFVAKISNNIFSNGKDGILDVFDTYNFTIDEDDLTDAEVAVDPEMLGKIFEKMISVSKENIDQIVSIYKEKGKVKIGTELNKKFGAFYTPREIVHYMTRESLIAYLSTNISGKKEENELKIRSLIDAKDQHLSSTETIQLFGDNESSLSTFVQEVDMHLQKVKIIDPAVGSGAFPMGILHEVSTLRYYLHSESFCTVHNHETEDGMEELTEDGHISMYQIKRETIKNSIYGVDIEPGAIDIARLRFWLSLVVDAEHPEPLPNFEFKFVCANTLIPLDDDTSKKQMEFGMLEEANLKTVKRYKREYYNADTKTEKSAISAKLREYTRLPALRLGDILPKRSLQIDEFGKNFDNPNHSHSFFDASLMVSEWRGFDIVIGNPPYDVYDKKEKSDELEEIFKSKIYEKAKGGKINIYRLFLCKSVEMLKQKGILVQLFQNSFLADSSAKELRKFFLQEQKILVIDSFPERDSVKKRVFESVKMSVCILLSQNIKLSEYIYHLNVWNDRDKSSGINANFSNIETINFDSNCTIQSIREEYKPLIKKISTFPKLIEVGKCWTGEIDLTIQKGYLRDPDAKYTSMIKGAAVQKWHVRETMSQGDEMYLDAEAYLQDNKGKKSLHHKLRRIVMQGITGVDEKNRLKMTIIQPGIFCGNSVNYVLLDKDVFELEYILSLMNSKILNWFFKIFSTNSNVNGYEVDNLPVPQISSEKQKPFITLVDQIFDVKKLDPKIDTSDLEKQLDKLVYELYGLTEEEIKVVEGD